MLFLKKNPFEMLTATLCFRFKGKIIHSHDYKHASGYEDKRIVIIGIGNSGGDAAVELSRVASQVLYSM